jgi:hypothetical protein
MTDYNAIPARHDAVNLRLEEWARWVKVRPAAWCCQPMFRLYRAPKQWESDLQIRIEIDTLAAHEIERAISFLPPPHRTALRWSYVFSHVPVNAVRRELAVTREGLGQLINDARDMLVNRLRERLIEK